jgi:methylase of polypeptide subunit release factors
MRTVSDTPLRNHTNLTARMDPIETLPTQESVGRKGARFEPAGFTEEAAAVLLSILQNSEYECATRLPQAGGNRWYSEPVRLAKFASGGVNCWKESPWQALYTALLEREKGPSPAILFDLLFFHQNVARDRISTVINTDSLRILEDAGILSASNDAVKSKVRCYPIKGKYFLCDPSRDRPDFVYIGWDSHLMVDIAEKYCRGRHFSRSLDLCTGSGVQGLSLAGQSEESFCADINPRALAMVEANARLNKLTTVRAVHSDLFSNIPGRFDCITANTPYVPHPVGAQLPIGGGDIGIEFTLRLLHELPGRLTEDGISVIYTSDPIVQGKRQLLARVTSELGHLPFRIILVPLFTNNYPMTRPMQKHYDLLGLSGYDDCILIIERGKKYEVQEHQHDWIHYYRTRVDAWLDWRRRAHQL